MKNKKTIEETIKTIEKIEEDIASSQSNLNSEYEKCLYKKRAKVNHKILLEETK